MRRLAGWLAAGAGVGYSAPRSLSQPTPEVLFPALFPWCRYDCVEELLAEDEMAFNVGTCLSKLPKDLDK